MSKKRKESLKFQSESVHGSGKQGAESEIVVWASF